MNSKQSSVNSLSYLTQHKWYRILNDKPILFSCNLNRSFHKGDIVSSSRVIVGVDAAIADAASLALMVESVGQGTDQWKVAAKRYAYFDDNDSAISSYEDKDEDDDVIVRCMFKNEYHKQ